MTAAEQLADARRKLGLSLDDLSSRTKISVERLSAVERADSAALPSFVSLKGFVRAYAAEVKLDADAIWGRYISELPDPLALTSVGESLVIIPTHADALAEFDAEDSDLMPPQPTSAEVAVVPPVERPMRAAEREPLDAAATAVVGARHPPLAPPAKHRKSFPFVPLVLATTLVIVGAYLLSENMGRHVADSDAVPASGPSREPGPASSARASTHQQPSVSRPMDTERGRTPPARPAPDGLPRRPTDMRNQTSAAPSDSIRNSTSNTAGRPSAGRQSVRAGGRGAVDDQSAPATAPPAAADLSATTAGGSAENADTVSGAWNLTSEVESTTLAAYDNLMLGFRLDLEQRGNQVVGEGRKVSENGAALPAQRRTPIKVEGTLEGNRLTLDFTEVGARRTSAGRFMLYLTEDGSFRGRFRSDAAQSSGVTVAVRESSSGRD